MASSPPEKRRYGRRVLAVLLALLLLVAGLLLSLATEAGTRGAVRMAVSLVNGTTSWEVQIEAVAGTFYSTLEIGRVVIADGEGPCFDLKGMRFEPLYSELLKRHLALSRAEIDEIVFIRRPVKKKKWQLPRVPALASHLRIDHLHIARFQMPPESPAGDFPLSMTGRILPVAGMPLPELLFTLNSVNSDGIDGKISFFYEGDAPRLEGHMEDSSLLPALLEVPSPLQATIRGEGPRSHWEAFVTVHADDDLLAEGSLSLQEGEEESSASVKGKVLLSRLPAVAGLSSQLGDTLEAEAQGRLDQQGLITLEKATVKADKLSMEAKSAVDLSSREASAALMLHYQAEASEAPYEVELTAERDGATLRYVLTGRQESLPLLSGAGDLVLAAESTLTGTLDCFPGRMPLEGNPFKEGETLQARFDLQYDYEKSQGRINEFIVHAADLETACSGWFDLEEESFAIDAALDLSGAGLLQAEEALAVDGRLKAILHAVSEEQKGTGSLALEAEGLQWTEWKVGALQAEATFACDSWRRFLESSWQTGVTLTSAQMLYRQEDRAEEVREYPLEDLQLAVALSGKGVKELYCESLEVKSGGVAVSGAGELLSDGSAARTTLTIEMPEGLTELLPFLSLPSFALSASVDSTLSWNPLHLEGVTKGRVVYNESTPPSLSPWLQGSGLAFEINAETDGSEITLTAAEIVHALATLQMQGSHRLEDQHYNLKAQMDAPDLSLLHALVDQDISGRLSAEARLTGDLDAFEAEVNLDASRLKVADRPALQGKLRLFGEGAPQRPQLRWEGHVAGEEAALLLSGQGSLQEDRFVLDSFTLEEGKNRASLSGSIPFAYKDTELRASFNAPELATLAALLDLPLSGKGEGTLAIADNALESRAVLLGLTSGSFQSETVVVEARARGLMDTLSGSATVTVEKATVGALALDHIQGEVQGTPAAASLSFTVNDFVKAKEASLPAVALQGEMALQEEQFRLTALKLGAGETLFTLKEAVLASWAPGRSSLSPLILESAHGAIRAEGRMDNNQIDGSLRLSAFPLSVLEQAGLPPLTGTVQGEVLLQGSLTEPRLKGRVQVENAVLENEEIGSLPPAALLATLELGAGRVALDSQVTLTPGARAEARLSFPLEWCLYPWRLHWEESSPLDGALSFESDFQPLLKEVALVPHALEGKMAGSFKLGGSLVRPELTGEARLQEVQYTNITTGTSLHEMRFLLTAKDGALLISDCSARAGEQGGLKAEGSILLDLEKSFPLSLTITLDHAQMVHLAYASAVVDGPLELKGNLKEMLLSGKLEISPVEATMPDQLMLREPPRLEIIEMGQEAVAPSESSPFSDIASSIRLDIDCSMPRKIYARAPILDSEWHGVFHVGGDLSDPKAEGRVAVRRGVLDFLNQRFELAESAVLFTGKSITEPTMDMRAVVETKEISATVRLEGELDSIAMKLESSPSLPQDEILSHILFGKDLTRISPVQALQLARVAAMFNRDLGGLRFFSGNVSVSGIDRIDLRTGEKIDDAAVGLGKYFTDSVYVEVEQGTAADSGRISVEVELSPQLSIKGDVDARDRSGVGLFWRKDY